MPKTCKCCPYWLHLSVQDDLPYLIETGLIWKLAPRAQSQGVRALIDGRAPLNDRVPPKIAAFVRQERASQAPRGVGP